VERIDPIARWPGGAPRIEPALRPERIEREQNRERQHPEQQEQEPEQDEESEDDGREHIDISA
jgi:hypothetical protein